MTTIWRALWAFRVAGLIVAQLLTGNAYAQAPAPAQFSAKDMQAVWRSLLCVFSERDGNLAGINNSLQAHLLETRNPYLWAGLAVYRLRELEAGNPHIGHRATLEAAEAAVQLAPDAWEGLLVLSLARIREGRTSNAKALVAKAEKLGADASAIGLVKSELALAMRDPRMAEGSLRSALSGATEKDSYFSPQILNLRLAGTLRLQRHYDETVTVLRAAIQAGPTNACGFLAQYWLAETILLYQGSLTAQDTIDRNVAMSRDYRFQNLASLIPYVRVSAGKPAGASSYAPDEAALELVKYPVGARVVPEILRAGLIRNINVLDGQGNSLLILAAKADLPDVARALILAGAKVDHPNQNGGRALGYFCANGSAAGVRILLDAHAQVNYKDREGITPLDAAVAGGNAAVVRQILAKSPTIAAGMLNNLMVRSAYFGMTEVVQELVRRGAQINPPKTSSMPPLVAAILSRDRELIAWLLAQGADTKTNFMNRSVADHARDTDDPEILRLIVSDRKERS